MRLTKLLIGTAFALTLTAAAANADVVVSSKIDTEGGVLGNIILAVLNANNIKTVDRVQLGATPVVRKAITAHRHHHDNRQHRRKGAWRNVGGGGG